MSNEMWWWRKYEKNKNALGFVTVQWLFPLLFWFHFSVSSVLNEPEQNYCCSRTSIYHLVVSIRTYACFLWVHGRAHAHTNLILSKYSLLRHETDTFNLYTSTHIHNKRRIWIIYFLRKVFRRVRHWGTVAQKLRAPIWIICFVDKSNGFETLSSTDVAAANCCLSTG